jgi:hypothetical protein
VSALPDDPTAQELMAELQKADVGDFLVHTCSLVASMAYGKLVGETRDLAQAQRGIEALKALEPLLPDEARKELQPVVASLQLAYAEAAAAG